MLLFYNVNMHKAGKCSIFDVHCAKSVRKIGWAISNWVNSVEQVYTAREYQFSYMMMQSVHSFQTLDCKATQHMDVHTLEIIFENCSLDRFNLAN